MTDHAQGAETYIEVVRALPVPISIASLERGGAVYFVNRALTDVFGYSLDDLPDLNAFAAKALADHAAREDALIWWTETLRLAKYQGIQASPREFTMMDRSGRARQVVVHPTVIGGLVISAYQDKTGQREAERALASAERQLREEAYALTENIPVGTYTMVLEPGAELANFRFMSTRFLELTGLQREEAESDPLKGFACVHPDDYEAWVALNAETFAARKPFYGETRVIVQGKVRWISAESIPRQLEDGTIVWEGVLTDLSRQKAAEAALTQAHEELLQSSIRQSRLQEREALLQDMHDGFGSQLVMARRYLAHGSLTQPQLAELLDQCLADLHLLADTLQIKEPNLKVALANYRYRVQHRLEASGIEFIWQVSLETCPAQTSRTLVQIMRILQEAISNALRHARATRVIISALVDPHLGLRLEVLDNGVGMAPGQKTGQGLANMRRRADDIRAKLLIEANEPGTRVRLELPT